MQKKTERRSVNSADARESSIAQGWVVGGRLDDQSHEPGSQHAREITDSGHTAEAAHSLRADEGADSTAEARSLNGLSNAALVVFGVFSGLYLLYVWGWWVIAVAYSGVNEITADGSGVIGGALQQIVFWAAPAAPVLWFLSAVLLSRGGRTARLTLLLAVGAVLLVPLPMLIVRGA